MSADEMFALKSAVRRQLTRWGQQTRAANAPACAACRAAARILKDRAFIQGCALHVPDEEQPAPLTHRAQQFRRQHGADVARDDVARSQPYPTKENLDA